MSEQMTRREFEEQIIKKAQADNDFKEALVGNPKAALGQLGVQVSEDVEVKVVEESAKVIYLVLPVDPDELTDEQLEGVFGGYLCGKRYVACHTRWGPGGELPGAGAQQTQSGCPDDCLLLYGPASCGIAYELIYK